MDDSDKPTILKVAEKKKDNFFEYIRNVTDNYLSPYADQGLPYYVQAETHMRKLLLVEDFIDVETILDKIEPYLESLTDGVLDDKEEAIDFFTMVSDGKIEPGLVELFFTLPIEVVDKIRKYVAFFIYVAEEAKDGRVWFGKFSSARGARFS